MKKSLLVIMFLGVLFLTGCNKTTKCKLSITQATYKIDSEYKVIYNGDYAVKVESVETITSTDSSVLNTFEASLNDSLSVYKNLKHYEYSIKKSSGKLVEKTSIDYSKLDIDAFLKINSQASSLFSDGKIKYDTIISLYKSLGATCE